MSVERVTGDVDGLRWFKSSYSGSGGGDCVEVAVDSAAVHIRDSRAAGEGPTLRVSREEWAAFVSFAASAAGLDV